MKLMTRLMGALAAILILAGCNMQVELCDETHHPHTPGVRFHYEYNDGLDKHDSMYIVCTRVINTAKVVMQVDPTPEPTLTPYNPGPPAQPLWATGTFVLNAPGMKQPADYTIDETTGKWWYIDDPYTSPQVKFYIPVGWYRFITFNKSITSYDASSLMHYYRDNDVPLDSVRLTYRTFERYDPKLTMPAIGDKKLDEWEDNNSYSNFVQTNAEPIRYDSILLKEMQLGDTIIEFHPQKLSQSINVYFNIDKDVTKQQFTVEGVACEVSGIPDAIWLSDGELKVDKTHKMLFSTDFENSSGEVVSDTPTGTSLICHGAFNALGIVQNPDKETNVGPGVLQVIIYLRKTVGNKSILRRIQGRINIYEALQKNPLVYHNDEYQYFQTGEGADIRIGYNIKLDGDKILNQGGILNWTNDSGKDIEEAIIEEK